MPGTPRKPAKKTSKTAKTKAQIAADMRDSFGTPAPSAPTPADQWVKKGAAELEGVDLPLPSGNVARVKRVGLMELLAQGHIPDSLTPIAEEAVRKGKGLPLGSAKEILHDPDKLRDIEVLMRNVLVSCVVAPAVLPIPRDKDGNILPFTQRKPGLYADEVLDDDGMYIMNFVFGGARDVERFRREHGELVADVLAGEDLEDAAK